ncbi:hypothetical protein [Saccharothrix xinjiangensis]|uniref:Uncharacterized protein n=1 Tax=Saccharothrix xinjiangensis TaxID=204798 RepID=A0ABV9Y6H5_9PSEU
MRTLGRLVVVAGATAAVLFAAPAAFAAPGNLGDLGSQTGTQAGSPADVAKAIPELPVVSGLLSMLGTGMSGPLGSLGSTSGTTAGDGQGGALGGGLTGGLGGGLGGLTGALGG